MKTIRAGTRRKIEDALATHADIMRRFEEKGMSREDASRAASTKRIEMDRAWRSAERRRAFEQETGERDANSETYHARFLEWAIRL